MPEGDVSEQIQQLEEQREIVEAKMIALEGQKAEEKSEDLESIAGEAQEAKDEVGKVKERVNLMFDKAIIKYKLLTLRKKQTRTER